ncbi:hypothetical protein YB2330_005577 [Saitoella coloradoensis]
MVVISSIASPDPDQITSAQPITRAAWAQYGGLIAHPSEASIGTLKQTKANAGTATKTSQIAPFMSNYDYAPSGTPATANANIFRCEAQGTIHDQLRVNVLERHPYTTQSFIPLGRDRNEVGYVVVVADDKDGVPDLSTVRAFGCTGKEGVTYGVGQWHAPMIALKETTDFVVYVHENGVPREDCEEVTIEGGLLVKVATDASGQAKI